MKIGIQLYTLRDLTQRDFAAAVREVGQLGYDGVELAGFGNLKTPADVRKACDDAGLAISGGHVGVERLEGDLDGVMDEFDVLGCKALVVPWLPKERRASADAWRAFAASLAAVADRAASRGFTVAYHNHDFEFERFDGVAGLDLLWQSTRPDRVRCELDVHWVARAGVDPVAYMNQVGSPRVQFVHLKDVDQADPKKFAPVGTGRLDIAGICAAAESLGVEWGITEQDDCYGVPPMDVARTCIENLKKL